MWKTTFQYCIAVLFVLLWAYAASSKLYELDKFHGQLAQSPLILTKSVYLKWLVPISEIGLAILLMFRKTRHWGIIGSTFLMACFSWYILAITNLSPFIPCSCGGILDRLSWDHHLVFNCSFVILGSIAILIQPAINSTDPNFRIAIPG